MIDIKEKKDCCGCSACVQRCPKQCISLIEDNEGFLYPKVYVEKCIECGLCEKVCPVLNQTYMKKPTSSYAVMNRDEKERLKSSSGGCFTLFSKNILENGGVVYGASFDKDWSVHTIRIDKKEQLESLQGSKYLQSRTENTFRETEQDLKSGRLVLYSGTPCQIAALKLFLRKEYDNLITIDFICHGVPSPEVWRKHLNCLTDNKLNQIQYIKFRDKRTGWKDYYVTIKTEQKLYSSHFSKNSYLQGMLNNLFLRPSCHACPSKAGKSGSDITIADFWSVWVLHPDIFDNKGTSLVLINTQRGNSFFSQIEAIKRKVCFEEAIHYNQSWELSSSSHHRRVAFFKNYQNKDDLDSYIRLLIRVSLYKRVKNFIHSTLCHWGLWSTPEQRRLKKKRKTE